MPTPVAEPASFDADVNLNVRKTRLKHMEFGAASLGLAFRDGILNATLGGMELYDGHATGIFPFETLRRWSEGEGWRPFGPDSGLGG